MEDLLSDVDFPVWVFNISAVYFRAGATLFVKILSQKAK